MCILLLQSSKDTALFPLMPKNCSQAMRDACQFQVISPPHRERAPFEGSAFLRYIS